MKIYYKLGLSSETQFDIVDIYEFFYKFDQNQNYIRVCLVS
jgi:hypothetical protein